MKSKQVFIFNIIIFLYQFEFISSEGDGVTLSIYRLGILPLLLIFLLIDQRKLVQEDNNKYIVLFLYFSFSFITLVGYGYYSSLTSLFGNIIQLIAAYFFFRNNKIGKSTLLVLTTWGVFQLPYFISDFMSGSLGLSHRFVGFHWDPNYLCLSLLVSMWAKIYLLKYDLSKISKVVLIGLVFADILMILFSLSRGGLLALILTAIIYTFVYHRKIFYILSVSSVSLITYMIERSRWITWSDSLSLIDMIIYRTFTTASTGDISSGRLGFIENYIEVLQKGEGVFLGIPLHYYIEYMHGGAYPHNSIIEILLPSGAVIGSVFYIFFVFQILKIMYYSFKSKSLPYELFFLISGLSVLMLLSFGSKISWLFVGLVFAISNKQIFKKHPVTPMIGEKK